MTGSYLIGAPVHPADESHEQQQPQKSRRWLPRTLTGKLVTGVVVLVAALVVGIGVGTYFALRQYLYDQLDQTLASAARQNTIYVSRCVERVGPIAAPQSIRCFTGPPPPQHEWMVARQGDFELTPNTFPNVTALDLSTAQFDALERSPGSIRSITVGGERLRVTGNLSEDQSVFVVTGLSTDGVSTTLGKLLGLEIIIGALALGVASTATLFGVRRSLGNLYRVTGTAREVAAELSPDGRGLDRRVPLSEEGTEVGQLAESFNTMLEAVEMQFKARLESEQRMRQFMADASHELRTPLTSIRGYAELARMQRGGSEPADDNLSRIESEGTRMSRLVEDLLMLARGDAPDSMSTRRELVDVADLLGEVVSSARAAYPERTFDIDVIAAPHVIGDRDQLLRLVRNLVNNAAVHTDPGRPILVRAWEDGDVYIQVIDGGPGLPPEQAAQVFERFWRADKARSRARGGTGLGMSIVASLARLHGGSVHFQSTVELGSTVTVRLPSAHAE